jgi:hypothetical protein
MWSIFSCLFSLDIVFYLDEFCDGNVIMFIFILYWFMNYVTYCK